MVGALDAKEPEAPPAPFGAVALQQPVLAHQPLHPLAVYAPAELPPRQGGDHPGPVGRIAAGDFEHDSVAAGGRSPAG